MIFNYLMAKVVLRRKSMPETKLSKNTEFLLLMLTSAVKIRISLAHKLKIFSEMSRQRSNITPKKKKKQKNMIKFVVIEEK